VAAGYGCVYRDMNLRSVFAGACAGVAVALVLGASPAFAATWSVVPSPAVTAQSGLFRMDLTAAGDGWAVGWSQNGGLVQHWNGTQLSVVASPDILDHGSPNNSAALNGVDALSTTSAFAVGTSASYNSTDGLLHKRAVAERWNGSAWSTLTVPNPQVQNELNAVKAFSATDAWAVGRGGEDGALSGSTLALHWNGSAWSPAATPSPGTRDNILSAVSATSPTDMWAVGYYRDQPYGNRMRHPLAVHWNGSAWSLTPTPNVGAVVTFLKDVAAVSATDAWAVGYADNGAGGNVAVVMRWNGQAWSVAAAPALATLTGVTALSGTDVWATGMGADGLPYVANWRGSSWSLTAVPTGSLPSTSYFGIAALTPSTVWGVGATTDPNTGAWQPRAIRTTNG
jgi:hypothetical protein